MLVAIQNNQEETKKMTFLEEMKIKLLFCPVTPQALLNLLICSPLICKVAMDVIDLGLSLEGLTLTTDE